MVACIIIMCTAILPTYTDNCEHDVHEFILSALDFCQPKDPMRYKVAHTTMHINALIMRLFCYFRDFKLDCLMGVEYSSDGKHRALLWAIN